MRAPHRYVFIAGLHRTGTSLLARIIADHPQISAISGAPVPEDEGCYLQGAIPHTARHGIPGEYATDPAQHHVEGGRYDTLETKMRLEADWGPWFDGNALWRLEKSPVNLTRMRLLQGLFPASQFIVILRHPAAMAAALAKWTDRPFAQLVSYSLQAYEIMAEDLSYLHCAMVLRYEDLVADPARHIGAAHAFLGLEEKDSAPELYDGNAEYGDAPPMPLETTERAARWGYENPMIATAWQPIVRHPLRAIGEATLARLSGG